MKAAIIDYGAGNVCSLQHALERLGVSVCVTAEEEQIRSADKVFFPGVGAAGMAMESLRASQLDRCIPNLTQPVLGICLGMQLMCRSTEEDQCEGLGIFDAAVRRFETEKAKVPHMGWNAITHKGGPMFEKIRTASDMYFVHSYYVPTSIYSIANASYGQRFTAAMQKQQFYACQFHPEKSGKLGQQFLENFLAL